MLRESCPRCRKEVGFNGGSPVGSHFCNSLLQNYILHIVNFDSHESSMPIHLALTIVLERFIWTFIWTFICTPPLIS